MPLSSRREWAEGQLINTSNRRERHAFGESAAAAFLSACTSTPVSEHVPWAVRQITTLLEHSVRSGDTSALQRALFSEGLPETSAADVFASAVQNLADTVPDCSYAELESLVHRCAKIERMLFGPEAIRGAAPAGYAFAM